MIRFPFYRQLDSMDCGPSCLRMVAKHYGHTFSLQTLREKCHITREGVSLLGISDAAKSIGFQTQGVRISFDELVQKVALPCIIHWKQNHFVVVYAISGQKVHLADPAVGLTSVTIDAFCQAWLTGGNAEQNQGIALLLEPTSEFFQQKDERPAKISRALVQKYLKPFHRYFFHIFLGLLFGSIVQLILPFLTQALVDWGIQSKDISFIFLLLAGQMVFFLSRLSVDYIRNWILLHLSSRINIALVSDFLSRMMKLPAAFFQARNTGDILQRVSDHRRIESFLTTSSLDIIFSALNVVIFSIVLGIYSLKILTVFMAGTAIYILWLLLFMARRRELDQQRFEQLSETQNELVQIIAGMQDIKINNCEKMRRWEWESLQSQLFQTQIREMNLIQRQQAGALMINESKNILITFLAAMAVIHGEMTLGMMLAAQFIIGQLNAPFSQLLAFLHSAQDARVSLERLGEVYSRKTEQEENAGSQLPVPDNLDLFFKKVSFQYEGPHSPFALNQFTSTIPEGKVTAIVGTSGSGKTTLLKIILGFYKPVHGDILVGNTRLLDLHMDQWRQECGVVLQDGFIFTDTIAKNIAMQEEEIDIQKLIFATEMANIRSEIEELPMGFDTRIGAEGLGLSQGQKQRILIARAVYKNPSIILLDEATNALDATNERIVMNNLRKVFQGKTVLIVAHRLSTVMHADQVLVLEKGCLVESGTHQELVALGGRYYQLIKNQLELGSD